MKRVFSVVLALAMLIGLIPAFGLIAFAAEPTEITEIKTKMSVDTVPKAGMEVTHFMPNVPDGEPYSRPWNGAEWYDSTGVIIAPRLNHHYDRGYEFEAGRTYYADYQYTAGNIGYSYFHIELEDEDGKQHCLAGQIVMDKGYQWTDGVEPVLMELLEGIAVCKTKGGGSD